MHRRIDAADRAAPALLAWYDTARRDLPWRSAPGSRPDPYRVWLSEVMLQQTTVATVIPYFSRFLERWPDIESLAAADLDDVLAAWAGLGYYARARNLHKCARAVSARGGAFPTTEAALKELPGIGEYMAAAIAAIAFDQPATVVDGNVKRVIARFAGIETPLPRAQTEIRAAAAGLTPASRAGDYAQALMDLGATVCTPRQPACGRCPWFGGCTARANGRVADLPRRAPRPKRPTHHAVAFWLERTDPVTGAAQVLLRRRPEEGLLGGMMELPSTPWNGPAAWATEDAIGHAPIAAEWRDTGEARHSFTHFHLKVRVWQATCRASTSPEGRFVPLEDLPRLALPTAVKKMIRTVRMEIV